MSGSLVIWIATAYPFGEGEQFITPELPAWARHADTTVVMLPVTASGVARGLPSNFEVDEVLARNWRSRRELARATALAAIDPSYRRELMDLRSRGALTPATAAFALRVVAQGVMVSRAIADVVARRGHADVVYTYWMKPYIAGALHCRDRGLVGRVVSRAHGTDLYEEARPHHYTPLARTRTVDLDRLFVISDKGREYAISRYGFDAGTVRVSRLGVELPDEGGQAPRGQEDFEIVSISSLTPLKRIDLLVRALEVLAPQLQGRRIRWRHYGDGPLREEVEELVATRLQPLGVVVDLRGAVPHEELLAQLSTQPADLMVNTSSSEGVPVSIMEAAARGIPCVATDVGATVEVVGEGSAYLVPADVTPQELAARIVELQDDCRSDERRRQVRALVEERYDGPRNFRAFVDAVLSGPGSAR